MSKSIWVIERKHPSENEKGWLAVPALSFRLKSTAMAAAKRKTNWMWMYRAVEYIRKEPQS